MAEGHGRDEWGRASLLCSMIANTNRDPKKGRAFKPSDFDPYPCEASDNAVRVDKSNIGDLKAAMLGTGEQVKMTPNRGKNGRDKGN